MRLLATGRATSLISGHATSAPAPTATPVTRLPPFTTSSSSAITLSLLSESCRIGVRAGPARTLWLGRRLGDDGRHPFGIDVESEEGQGLAAGVAPLVDEAGGLVDQRSRPAVRRLSVDSVRADARDDVVERRARAMVRGVRGHPRCQRAPRQVVVANSL